MDIFVAALELVLAMYVLTHPDMPLPSQNVILAALLFTNAGMLSINRAELRDIRTEMKKKREP